MKRPLIFSMLLLVGGFAFADTPDERISAMNQNRESEISSVMSLYEYDQFRSVAESAGLEKAAIEEGLRSMSDDQLKDVAQSAREARNMMSFSDRDTVNLLLILLIVVAIVAVVAIAAD